MTALLVLAAGPFGAALLVWATSQVARKGWAASPLAPFALTASALLFALYVVKDAPFSGLTAFLYALVPPAVVLDPMLARHWSFLSPLLPFGVAAGIGASLVLLRWSGTRAISLAAGLPVTLVSTFALGEAASRAAMCDAAAAHGRDAFARAPLWRSWIAAPAEYQFDLHAGWRDGDVLMAWSYGAGRFYVVPPTARSNVDLPRGVHRCG